MDADETMLGRARKKAVDSGLAIAFDHGLADALPYPDASFEVALSSLVFHHLSTEAKRGSFAELFRCLKPGGRLHVADWGGARGWLDRALFLPVRLLDGFETTADNIRGRLPGLMAEAGFYDVHEDGRVATPLGVISLYRARKPATDHQGG
jgi:SAM-dependent methyltransferase